MSLELVVTENTVELVQPTLLEVVSTPTTLILGGNTGPQGPAGDVGGVTEVQAAEDLTAYSFITSTGRTADSGNTTHLNRVVGIVLIDVLTGFIASLQTAGEVTNTDWSWSPGSKLFLNGTSISATPPSSGFSQMIAVARNAVIIIVKLEPPILL